MVDGYEERCKQLDQRTALQYFTDKIPGIGHHLKLNRMNNKRKAILGDLEKTMEDPKDVEIANAIMVEHNEEAFFDAGVYHSVFKWLCGAGGLIYTGYLLGTYSK